MDKTYNPTRISFEIDPKKKEELLIIIPSGKVSKVYQNFTEYLLAQAKADPLLVKKLAYITEMDFMDITEKAQGEVKESVNELLNTLRVAIGLDVNYTNSISGIKRSILEMQDAVSNRRFL